MDFSKIERMFDFSFIFNQGIALDFLSGIGTTLFIALIGVIIGVILGLFLAIGKLLGHKFTRGLCTIYINFVRCTPLLVQLFMIHYVPPTLSLALFDTVIIMNPFVSAIIAVGLNSAAYVAEIFRAGILSVDKGQFEAARSLGFNYKKTLKLIIVPQATKNILPALGNEFTSVIKETAIVSIIGAKDIMFYANQIRNIEFNPFPPLFMAACIYFVIVYTLIQLVNLLERKLNND